MADAGTQTGQPHKGLVKGLVIAASVILVIACFSAWAERQALTTDDWVKTSDRLLQNEAIQKALANYAVDQLYANVNVEAELDKALPPNFKRLSGPASTGLRSLATSGAERVIATDRFQQAWEKANRTAHKTLIAIIEDKGDVVSTSGGEVTLELRPLITQVANQLGIGKDLADQIPPDVGNLKIISSDELGAAQTIAKLIRGLALVTSLLALGMFALAIYLSRGYRWITVLSIGIGAILAGILVLILREIAGNVLVDQLATEGAKPAAEATWSIGTSLLASIARTVILYGVFFLIAAWLASPHRSAIATRRAMTPVLRDFPAWVWSVFGVFGIIYVLTGVDSTRAVLSRLILLALAGFGIYELRRRSIAEFPDVKMGEMPTRVRARVESMWRGRERLKPEPHDRKLERLERLADLHERGVLSDEEFESEKAAVLAAGGPQSSPPAA